MEIDAIFEQLPETANECAGPVRVGRHCDVEYRLTSTFHVASVIAFLLTA